MSNSTMYSKTHVLVKEIQRVRYPLIRDTVVEPCYGRDNQQGCEDMLKDAANFSFQAMGEEIQPKDA
ncbi:hypothetical protein J6590_037038 [Homalodisca vitripennis]|nr:hypothetical protein J6590_037038 [Homalodisca vitripennis]